jgi:hypothetical protein
MAVKTLSKFARVLVVLGAAAFGCGRVPLDLGGSGSGGSGGAGGASPATCGPNRVAVYCPDCRGGRTFVRCSDPAAASPCPKSCVPPTPCSGLEEASCNATLGCTAQTCPTCDDPRAFSGCYQSGDPPPICVALASLCPTVPACSTLDEMSCKARSDCHASYCGNCSGAQLFAACLAPNEAATCPAYACPINVPPCSALDAATCKTRGDCQPEYCCGGEVYEGCGITGATFTCMTSCPAPPQTCTGLDEATCNVTYGCQAQSCPDCMGGQTFAGCAAPGGAGVICGPCPPTCSGLDETSCEASGYCHLGYCANCGGGQTFNVCLGPNEVAPCPQYACPVMPRPCSGLDEMTCNARGDCQAEYCNWCQQRAFVGCADPGTGFACPAEAPPCPPVPCAAVMDQLSCDARTDCHSVFIAGDAACDCSAPGCCTTFLQCREGGKAVCAPPQGEFCTIAPPSCEAPAYVTSYTPNCYEGCVRPSECGP